MGSRNWSKQNSNLPHLNQQLMSVEEEEEQDVTVTGKKTSRSLSVLTQTSEIETLLANAATPFAGPAFADRCPEVNPSTLWMLETGCSLQDLIDACPEDVLTVLKDMLVAEQGTFKAKDSDILLAFRRCNFLTRSSDQHDDPFWETNWKEYIEERVNKSMNKHIEVGWEEMVTLKAYVVCLRDIVNRKEGDLLALLLRKSGSGAAARSVWEFPVVRAVVDYHWTHWARRFLLIVFCIFLIWTMSFCFYVYAYIETRPHCKEEILDASAADLASAADPVAASAPERESGLTNGFNFYENSIFAHNKRFRGDSSSSEPSPDVPDKGCNLTSEEEERIRGAFSGDHTLALMTHITNLICFACSCPFTIQEIWSIFAQKQQWMQLQNLADISLQLIQIVIFALHVADCGLTEKWFGWLLAIQTILLLIQVQRFFRLLGEGSTFLDSAIEVIYAVRLWIVYIMLAGISASLCIGSLYRHDAKFHQRHNVFNTPGKLVATTFQIIFGDFDLKYIFDAETPWIQFSFFFGFQILMTITVLNLLIAAMSQAYSETAEEKLAQLYRGRAQAIHEMHDLYFTQFIMPVPETYLHFLTVDKKKRAAVSRCPSMNEMDSGSETEDLRREVRDLSMKLNEIVDHLKSLSRVPSTELGNNGSNRSL